MDTTFKGFCKKNNLNKDKEKSMRKYCSYLCRFLPELSVYSRYILDGKNTQDANTQKERIITQYTSEPFMKWMKECIKDDEIPEDAMFYPIIVGCVLDDLRTYDVQMEDWVKTSLQISEKLSKRDIDKLCKKANISKASALNLITCVGYKDGFEFISNVIPEDSVPHAVIKKIVRSMIEDSEIAGQLKEKSAPDYEYIFGRFGIALVDVYDKIIVENTATNTDEGCMSVLNSLTDWAYDTMNELDDKTITSIIWKYVKYMKANPEATPVLLAELPSQYIRIRNMAYKISKENQDVKKYLKAD
jgi:hypothetical protein